MRRALVHRRRTVKEMTDDELTLEILGTAAKPSPGKNQSALGLPRCPEHLSGVAAKEWRRVARLLHGMGVLMATDRAALAAYCQCYGRWVEAEERLRETPTLFKTPAGYVQQSPWLGIVNKQLELMGRYMIELGLTPASRSRVITVPDPSAPILTGQSVRDLSDAELDAEIARLCLGQNPAPVAG